MRGWLTLLAAAAAYPTLRFWRNPGAAESRESWLDAGPVGDLPSGGWVGKLLMLRLPDRWRLDEREVTVYLRRMGEDVAALSAVCTHTGCLVRRRDEGFSCPCHESAFDAEGESLAGPAPRPLDRLETKVERGRVKVRHQLFRGGIPDKRPLAP
jgi:Rieske Fe-S protein